MGFILLQAQLIKKVKYADIWNIFTKQKNYYLQNHNRFLKFKSDHIRLPDCRQYYNLTDMEHKITMILVEHKGFQIDYFILTSRIEQLHSISHIW